MQACLVDLDDFSDSPLGACECMRKRETCYCVKPAPDDGCAILIAIVRLGPTRCPFYAVLCRDGTLATLLERLR